MSDFDDMMRNLKKESEEMKARYDRDMESLNNWKERQEEIRHEKWLEASSKDSSSSSDSSTDSSYTAQSTTLVKTWTYKETFARMPFATIFGTIGGVIGMIYGATIFGGPSGAFGLIIVLVLAGTVGLVTGAIGMFAGGLIGLPIDGLIWLIRKAGH